MVFSEALDWLFAPIVNNFSQVVSVIVISLIFTVIVTFIYKKFTNQQELKSIKEEMTQLRGSMKDHKDNPEKLTEINKRIWELSSKQMRSNFKPMLITMIPLLLIANWMRTEFAEVGLLINWGFKIPLLGTGFTWIGTYIVTSIVIGMLLRKIFKIY